MRLRNWLQGWAREPDEPEPDDYVEELGLALALSLSDRQEQQLQYSAEQSKIAEAKRKSVMDPVSNGLAEALSCKYWTEDSLDYGDVLVDGFFDCWGPFKDVAKPGEFPSLASLRRVPRVDDDPREVLIVNHDHDLRLCVLASEVTAELPEDATVEQRIAVLARVVSRSMGGEARSSQELAPKWRDASRNLKRDHRGIVIPLGELRVGQLRHRALLFKVLADAVQVQCRLLRDGRDGAGPAGDNVGALVRVGGEDYIVDVMRKPGRLVRFGSGDISRLLATPTHSRTPSFNDRDGGFPTLNHPQELPDLMSFDSPLPKNPATARPLPEVPEHPQEGGSLSRGPSGPEASGKQRALTAEPSFKYQLAHQAAAPLSGQSTPMESAASDLDLQPAAPLFHRVMAAQQLHSPSTPSNKSDTSSRPSTPPQAPKPRTPDGWETFEDGNASALGGTPFAASSVPATRSSEASGGQSNPTPSRSASRVPPDWERFDADDDAPSACTTANQPSPQQSRPLTADSAVSRGAQLASGRLAQGLLHQTSMPGNWEQPSHSYQHQQPAAHYQQPHMPGHYQPNHAEPQHLFPQRLPFYHPSYPAVQPAHPSASAPNLLQHTQQQQQQQPLHVVPRYSSNPFEETLPPAAQHQAPSYPVVPSMAMATSPISRPQDVVFKPPDPKHSNGLVPSSSPFNSAPVPVKGRGPSVESLASLRGPSSESLSSSLRQAADDVSLGSCPSSLQPTSSTLQQAVSGLQHSVSGASVDSDIFRALDPLVPRPPKVQQPEAMGTPMASAASSRPVSAGLVRTRTEPAVADGSATPPLGVSPSQGLSSRQGSPPNGLPITRPNYTPVADAQRLASNSSAFDAATPLSLAPPRSTSMTPAAASSSGAHYLGQQDGRLSAGATPPVAAGGSALPDGPPRRLQRQLTIEESNDDWEIDCNEVQMMERIGRGSYGEVFRGSWRHTQVAVKLLLDQSSLDQREDTMLEFKREVAIMKRLRHPNILQLMAVCLQPPNVSMITQFCPRGSLFKLMHSKQQQPAPQVFDERRRMQMARDVACGMHYLHTQRPPIVHKDLKSPNLLVDKDWTVKVCDFGLSRVLRNTLIMTKHQGFTPEWAAPEVLQGHPYNEKCDIYSYGVVLWELATLCKPWEEEEYSSAQIVGVVGYGNARLDIPEDLLPSVAQLIDDCFQRDPQLRPTFEQILDRLKGLRCFTKQAQTALPARPLQQQQQGAANSVTPPLPAPVAS